MLRDGRKIARNRRFLVASSSVVFGMQVFTGFSPNGVNLFRKPQWQQPSLRGTAASLSAARGLILA